MKPLNLREYAEALALTDDREFALEILENLDLIDEYDPVNFMYDINNMLPKELHDADNWSKIENIGDRLQLLSEIQDMHAEYNLKGDANDLAREHCEIVLDLRNMLKLEEGADLVTSIEQLLERIPEYDL
jgi:hypothetical protein